MKTDHSHTRKEYVLVLLFIKYVSDKYAGVPYAPITISPEKLGGVDDLIPHIRITDFKISAEKTARGVGFEGRVSLELEKGLSEEAIRCFNLLVDYAFYCGTGIWTEDGLGQTRRAGSSSQERGGLGRKMVLSNQ